MSQTPEQNHSQEEDNIPLQHDAEHERPPRNKQQSVLIYLVILFAAAFLLMAMSYLMQRRSSDATIEDLRESVTAMQSVGDIQTQNETLRQQVAAPGSDREPDGDAGTAHKGHGPLLADRRGLCPGPLDPLPGAH